MIDFQRYATQDIVIYHQRLPGVKSVSIDWLIFTGAADDSAIGADGAHHWFEHVPFRGTRSFPGGYTDIQGPFTRRSGTIGAWTNLDCTCYWANIHLSQWKEALHTTASLWSEPLLTDEAINAEREIIHEEIREWHSESMGKAFCSLPGILWKGHPYGHHALGTPETLASLTTDMLRTAHAKGYDCSRAVLFVSGDMTISEVFAALTKTSQLFPRRGLSMRRNSFSYGVFPDMGTGEHTVETPFDTSVIFTLFPMKPNLTIQKNILWGFVEDMMVRGGLQSPLFRIVREERKLSYHVGVAARRHLGGGYFGVFVKTSTAKLEQALEAIADVFKDEDLRSRDRFEAVREGYIAESEMRPANPAAYNDIAIENFREMGSIVSEETQNAHVAAFSHEEVVDAINSLNLTQARTVIFKGT